MRGAIKGLLLDLDPHSVYFTAEEAKAFAERASGSYEGIGVEVQVQEDRTLRVIAPIEGGPAAAAGIVAGDVILTVDGKDIASLHGQEPLRGAAGSTVVLQLQRAGRDRPVTVTLRRQAIHVSSVRSEWLADGVARIRISNFQADTGSDFEKHVQRLLQERARPDGIVLDLRANPGGLLSAAVEVADSLLDSGAIVSTRGRLAASDTQLDATPGALLQGVPLVTLTDAGSASASEVLAAALRDNRRACVVGSKTFGKGSVQTVLPLDNGDSVKLTTARYYTPKGRSIQGVGIVPDHWLAAAGAEATVGTGIRSEAQLSGHLVGDEEGKAVTGREGEVLTGEIPLAQAVDYLRNHDPLSCSAAAAR